MNVKQFANVLIIISSTALLISLLNDYAAGDPHGVAAIKSAMITAFAWMTAHGGRV